MSDHINELAEHLGKVFDKVGGIDARDGFPAIAREVYRLKCVVLSPDQIPLAPEPHENLNEALQFAAAWMLRYVRPGYYSDSSRNRIPIDELAGHLDLHFVFDE